MKFLITMNMPVRGKTSDRRSEPMQQVALVHQVIIEHKSKTMEELNDQLNEELFIFAEEFYKGEEGYFSVGPIIINTNHIGKVKIAGDQGRQK